MIRRFMFAAAAAALVLQTGTADADCTISGKASVLDYYVATSTDILDTRCDPPTELGQTNCHLSGWLIKPASSTPATGNLPAVVFFHGSGQTQSRNNFCEIANYFTDRGYVFWAPYLRGVDDVSPAGTGRGFHNTGLYIEDWVDAQTSGNHGENTLNYLQVEVADVQAALIELSFLRSGNWREPLVAPNKIAIMGHSYGGALVVLAAKEPLVPLPRAAIDQSGAVLSWGDGPAWADRLEHAVQNRLMPMYFLQNMLESPEHSYDSTTELFKKADENFLVGPAEMAVYSQFLMPVDFLVPCLLNYPFPQCAHIYFHKDHDQVMRWIPGVRNFLVRNGVK
jgi:dienelactone hydrolase